MKIDDLDHTIASLLDVLRASFLLDQPLGERSLGEHLESIMRQAAATDLVEFGTPGDHSELLRSAEGVMNFFYRPHLFPGMDPALHLGHVVQYNLLPRALPQDSPIELAAMLESYCHLSGDLFGWQSTGDGEITLWVLDVSGHGVRAGFAAVVFKLILGEIDPGLPLTELAKEVESRFINFRNPEDPGYIYATGTLIRINKEGAVDYLSAGHPPILVRRFGGRVEQFEATAVPLALLPELGTASASFELGKEDTLLVCTDGLLELENSNSEVFGMEHTIENLAASDGSPCGVFAALTAAVSAFHELDRLDDDLSFVAIRLRR